MRDQADLGATEAAKIMRRAARSLHARSSLRADLPVDRAGDVLLALCSPHIHHLLRRQLGWSRSAYRTWLADALVRAVLR